VNGKLAVAGWAMGYDGPGEPASAAGADVWVGLREASSKAAKKTSLGSRDDQRKKCFREAVMADMTRGEISSSSRELNVAS